MVKSNKSPKVFKDHIQKHPNETHLLATFEGSNLYIRFANVWWMEAKPKEWFLMGDVTFDSRNPSKKKTRSNSPKLSLTQGPLAVSNQTIHY